MKDGDIRSSYHDMKQKFKGAHNELIACAWLLKNGYEVFRNVSPHGLIDILAIKEGSLTKIDVKSSYVEENTGKIRMQYASNEQAEIGVRVLGVIAGTDEVMWADEVINNNEKKIERRLCMVCSSEYAAKSANQKFCSKACQGVIHGNKRSRI